MVPLFLVLVIVMPCKFTQTHLGGFIQSFLVSWAYNTGIYYRYIYLLGRVILGIVTFEIREMPTATKPNPNGESMPQLYLVGSRICELFTQMKMGARGFGRTFYLCNIYPFAVGVYITNLDRKSCARKVDEGRDLHSIS
ncbi:hypothetical protein Lal_00024588 [Lupinus albus]|nr:hypothetical protein Lal_00024588 [Lupinus albus]